MFIPFLFRSKTDSEKTDDLSLASIGDRLAFRGKTYRIIQVIKNNRVIKYIKDPDNIYAVHELLIRINGTVIKLNLEEIDKQF